MWHDVHSHPHQLHDPRAALERAAALCVSTIVDATERPSEAPAILALRAAFPAQLHLAVGLHPATAIELGPDAATRELDLLPDYLDEAAAVGEIGLDFKVAETAADQSFQRAILEKQLVLAAEKRLPIELHSRRAQRQTLEVAIAFTEGTGLPALLHWFTASRKLVAIANEKGIYISAGPSVLVDADARKVVATIRLDRLLLETDCPVAIAGPGNEPARAASVAATVAELRGIPIEAFADLMRANIAAYLGRAAQIGPR